MSSGEVPVSNDLRNSAGKWFADLAFTSLIGACILRNDLTDSVLVWEVGASFFYSFEVGSVASSSVSAARFLFNGAGGG